MATKQLDHDMYAIAVDLGGTNVRVCAFKNGKPTMLELLKEKSNIGDEPSAVMAHIDRMVRHVVERLNITFAQVSHIGIAVPDAVSPIDGVLHFPSTMLKWQGVNIRKYFLDLHQVPVYVENDANMAALGEYHFGSGKGSRNLVYLTISTGVGAGIIIDGRLYQGSHGFAGELGQMILNDSALVCPQCGKPGCVEVLASGSAVRHVANASADTKLHDKDAAEIVELVREGDEDAAMVLKTVAANIAKVMLNIIFAFDPDVLVVGGGLSAAFDLIYPEIDTYLSKQFPKELRAQYSIIQNELGGDVGLLGALVVANRRNDHTLKTVIFDHDGVIAFTEDAHRLAFADVIKKHFDRELTPGDYNFAFQGKTDVDGFISYLDSVDEKGDPNQLAREASAEFLRTYSERVLPNANVIQTMKELHAAGIPIAIATSSNRHELETSLHAFDLSDCVSFSVTADDIVHSKPSPEMYIIAATRMNTLPDECLVIEDTPVGVIAAKEAGTVCIALTTTHAAPQLASADQIVSRLSAHSVIEAMHHAA